MRDGLEENLYSEELGLLNIRSALKQVRKSQPGKWSNAITACLLFSSGGF